VAHYLQQLPGMIGRRAREGGCARQGEQVGHGQAGADRSGFPGTGEQSFRRRCHRFMPAAEQFTALLIAARGGSQRQGALGGDVDDEAVQPGIQRLAR
jgi:hypothetical protein